MKKAQNLFKNTIVSLKISKVDKLKLKGINIQIFIVADLSHTTFCTNIIEEST